MPQIFQLPKLHKDLARLPRDIVAKFYGAVNALAIGTVEGKHLRNTLSRYHSYRIGDYRIIYEHNRVKNIIVLISCMHRKDVYKKAK